jgi:hypothetical protein
VETVKVKVTLPQAKNAQRWSRGIAPPFLLSVLLPPGVDPIAVIYIYIIS